jgi:sigma-B regulation protein RsbU (phosphoserine phosphatase)
VRRSDSTIDVVELSVGGTVIGLFPDVDYGQAAVELRPGDLLVAFTDGVPEALDAGGEEFGEERLTDLLRQSAGRRADEVVSTLTARMRDWIGTAEQHDDLTFVVVSLNG